ncbi:hypothetical protein GCM10022420_048110 [Streptomyces iranensis]|uniref:Helix-turn-helix domain protein n=1 Tax=Streptomyces iranensis TaxID=576784 RepID=A0A060ZYI6_9ACTN|nr:helix-turn-helix domain protein [Streptomyces iranensis]
MNVSDWASRTTGERIKYLRRTAELTQTQLADLAGISVATVQKAEQNKGELSIGYLLKLAAGLRTDVAVILGQQAPRHDMGLEARAALRQLADAVHESALGDWQGIGEPSTLDDLTRAHGLAYEAYWQGENGQFSNLTSKILKEGRARYEQVSGWEREQLGRLLASTYQAAASNAILLGQRDLAFAALTSAHHLSAEAGDPVLSALLDSTLSWAYLRDAKVERAMMVAERAASRIEPPLSKAPGPELLAYGRLMISAAVAASRFEKGRGEAAANEYLSRAHAAAYRVGRDKSLYGTHFGPTAANTEAVGIRVALGDYGRALKLERETHLPKSMPKLARNRYKLDVALAQVEAKLYDKAGDTLIEVGLDAPEWVKHQALPGVIGRRLAKVSASKVQSISEIIGVPLIV